jgi:hypothetical protein
MKRHRSVKLAFTKNLFVLEYTDKANKLQVQDVRMTEMESEKASLTPLNSYGFMDPVF